MHQLKLHFVFILSLFSLSITSCNNSTSKDVIIEESDKNEKPKSITAKEIEAIKYTEYALSDLAKKTTEDWLKFEKILESSIEQEDISEFSGKINLKEDPLEFQKKIRDEWN